MRKLTIIALLAGLGCAAPAAAQPVDLPIPPATTATYPPGVKIIGQPGDQVYANPRGLVLYGMDMRTLLRWSPDPALYCKDACAQVWEPLLAPAGTPVNIRYPQGFRSTPPAGFVQPQSAPDWTVIEGPQGAQWVYKGWHMVFTRRGAAAGSREWDGAEANSWNTLKFVPPVPAFTGPPGLSPRFHAGAYVMAGAGGRLLYTGTCRADCATWQPLSAPLASRGLGQWQVRKSDDSAQWAMGGKPVYIAAEESPETIPHGAKVVKP